MGLCQGWGKVSYKFKTDENVEAAFRRLGANQIRRAIKSLESVGENPAAAIHDARRRCKKLRALLRLVRPVFSGYARENAAFRDAATPLSGARDGQVMLETLDALVPPREKAGDDFSRLRERLLAARDEGLRHQPAVDDSLQLLREAALRCSSWELEAQGFDAIEAGLRNTYQRARKAYRRCRKDPSAARLHDWRKRMKYHGYHLRLLAPLWAPLVHGQLSAARDLANLLGEHHDLANLRQWLGRAALASENPEAVAAVQSRAQERLRELEEDALAIGRILLAPKPRELMKVFERWWKAAG